MQEGEEDGKQKNKGCQMKAAPKFSNRKLVFVLCHLFLMSESTKHKLDIMILVAREYRKEGVLKIKDK